MSQGIFSERNQFTFVCPVFNAKTKMATCLKLRELHWTGKRPPQRKGCQACMEASKCPAAAIVQKSIRLGSQNQLSGYFSATPVNGKIDQSVLGQILPVLVMRTTMERYGLSKAERDAIDGADQRIEAAIRTAPKVAKRRQIRIEGDTEAQPRKAISDSFVPKDAVRERASTGVSAAAKTGDMSAAINQASQ